MTKLPTKTPFFLFGGLVKFYIHVIMTTGLAGGLHCPYKGLIPACARKAH